MRRIKVYDQLSVYAQRMLSLMNDPGYAGLEADIYENEKGWVIKNGFILNTEDFIEVNDLKRLDQLLSSMLIQFVLNEIQLAAEDAQPECRAIAISEIAEYLVIEED